MSYDVPSDKKRNRVMKMLKDHGYHMQKSLFVFQAQNPKDAKKLYKKVLSLLKEEEDKIILLPICGKCFSSRKFFGTYPQIAESTWIF